MREKQVGSAGSAQTHIVDAAGHETRAEQLILDRRREVKVDGREMGGCMPGRVVGKELQGVGRRGRRSRVGGRHGTEETFARDEAPAKRRDDLLADAVAAGADSRADHRNHPARVGMELAAHHAHDFLRQPPEGPAPAGVQRRDRPVNRVNKQDRQAVGGSNGKQNSGLLGNQRVARRESLPPCERPSAAGGEVFDTLPPQARHTEDVCRVDLPKGREGEIAGADGLKKEPPVLLHRCTGLGFSEAEI